MCSQYRLTATFVSAVLFCKSRLKSGSACYHSVRILSSSLLSKNLTLRRLMSYIYIYMEHPFLMFLDHTQRRSTVGRTPLDE